jgi:hypothetical protein
MVTYDQYSEPDFFYDTEGSGDNAVGARRLHFSKRLIARILPKKSKNK